MNRPNAEALLACPVDWEAETGLEDYDFSPLTMDWEYCVRRHSMGEEEAYLVHQFLAGYEIELDLETEHHLRNLAERRAMAVAAYMTRSGRLHRLDFIRPSAHGKHYVASATRAQLVAKSKGGISYFMTDHSPEDLAATFWDWLFPFFGCVPDQEMFEILRGQVIPHWPSQSRIWQAITSRHQIRIAFGAVTPVGFVKGQESEYICLDLHLDNKVVHAYPVSETEAKEIMGTDALEYVDALQGVAK